MTWENLEARFLTPNWHVEVRSQSTIHVMELLARFFTRTAMIYSDLTHVGLLARKISRDSEHKRLGIARR